MRTIYKNANGESIHMNTTNQMMTDPNTGEQIPMTSNRPPFDLNKHLERVRDMKVRTMISHAADIAVEALVRAKDYNHDSEHHDTAARWCEIVAQLYLATEDDRKVVAE